MLPRSHRTQDSLTTLTRPISICSAGPRPSFVWVGPPPGCQRAFKLWGVHGRSMRFWPLRCSSRRSLADGKRISGKRILLDLEIVSHQVISSIAAALAALLCGRITVAAALSIQGPDAKPGEFRITVFASGLNYPLGMARLPDGSLLVTTSDGTGFFNSTGNLLRLVDSDQNGIADGPGTVLYNGLIGGLTSLRIGGPLVFVTGQGNGRPITVLRLGATATNLLTVVGQINVNY